MYLASSGAQEGWTLGLRRRWENSECFTLVWRYAWGVDPFAKAMKEDFPFRSLVTFVSSIEVSLLETESGSSERSLTAKVASARENRKGPRRSAEWAQRERI